MPASAELRFRARLWTRWSDEDNQQVLNNAVYLTLFEEGRHRYFGALGLLDDWHFSFVLMQCNARYLKPGRGGVEVELEMGTTHLGRSSFTQAYRLRDAHSGELWCEAEALLVCWDPAKRASQPMDARFRGAIEGFEHAGESSGMPHRP